MSIATTVALPNQPTTGAVNAIPLGGDGKWAPHSAYSVYVQSDGDGSGGVNDLTVRLDPQYTQVVSYVDIRASGVSADHEFRAEIACTPTEIFMRFGDLTYKPAGASAGAVAGFIWTPPAVVCSAGVGDPTDPPYVKVRTENTNGVSIFMTARIYNFDKRARELSPLPWLFDSFPRASN